MTNLHLLKQQAKNGIVTVEQLLALLGPAELDAIDAKTRQMR